MVMRKIISVLAILIVLGGVSVSASDWVADILDGYESRTIEMADDYSGKVVSTVARKKQISKDASTTVLYVHGYNDYFFQKELGDSVGSHGYAFYAVDLRKYGRSILAGQQKFEVKNLKEYFADVDSALNIIDGDGYKNVVLMGHSTGGLIVSYYMMNHKSDRQQVKAMVLNSPFLDWNLGKFQENFLVGFVAFQPFKNIKINQGDSRAYAESLLDRYHGEWDYDTDWKLETSQAVTTGWITAIHKAQKKLQKGAGIEIPILLMHSDKSVGGYEWTPQQNCGDGVLDVADISKYGKKLGSKVTEVTIEDGLHDLVLSRKDVRDKVYAEMFSWLKGLNL